MSHAFILCFYDMLMHLIMLYELLEKLILFLDKVVISVQVVRSGLDSKRRKLVRVG
jgi:hypothetical protein